MFKILVTGSRGMVGKNIVDKLNSHYTLLTPTKNELNLIDKSVVTKYLNYKKPDLIIHCAGVVGGIQANIAKPVSFLYDNSVIGLNIISWAYESGIKIL